jgi:hypothetical protein
MKRLTKIASAALIALVLAGGISTAAMAAPPRGCDAVPRLCDDPPPDDLAWSWGASNAPAGSHA